MSDEERPEDPAEDPSEDEGPEGTTSDEELEAELGGNGADGVLVGATMEGNLEDTQQREVPASLAPTSIVPAPNPTTGVSTSEEDEFPDFSQPPRRRFGGETPMRGLLGWIVAGVLLLVGLIVTLASVLPMSSELDDRQQQLGAANEQLEEMRTIVEDLQTRLSDRDDELVKLRASEAELAAEAALREQALIAMQQTQDELSKKLQAEIKKGTVLIQQRQGQLVMDLQDKILFDSGAAEINESGEEVLRSVGETLVKLEDKVIEVSGNTDSLPISKKLVDEFPTNWELSTARATNVVRFLQEEIGVPGERLVAIGNSQYRPVASNRSKSGRRRNRRIEVKLVDRPLKGGKK